MLTGRNTITTISINMVSVDVKCVLHAVEGHVLS